VARNVTAIALSTFLARGIQFGWAILLARLLGEAGYGVWGVIGGMISIAATLPEFGMGLIVLRDVARNRALSGAYLSATWVTQPPLAVLSYVLLIGAGLLLPYDTPTRLLLVIAGISLLMDTLGNIGHGQLLAAEQMVITSLIQIAHMSALIAFAFTALLRGGGLPGLYVATVLAGLLRAVMYWAALRHVGIKAAWPVDMGIVRHLFGAGLPIALGSFLSLAYQHIDKILALILLSEADAGNLVTAFVIVFGVIELVNITVLTALFPLMSRLAEDQPDALRTLTDQLAFLTLVIALPIGVGISGLSAKLAALLFPGFVSTSAVLELLIWHAVALMVGNAYSQMMIIQNRQGRVLVIRVFGLLVNIALNLVLLPRMGVPGASLSILISQLVLLIWFLIERRPGGAMLRYLGMHSLRAGLAALVMALCILALRESSPILAGAAGVLVYGLAVILFRVLAPEHWAIIRKVAHALPVVGPAFARLASS
jgi:O-antigen/teichoic acid export membrane protein